MRIIRTIMNGMWRRIRRTGRLVIILLLISYAGNGGCSRQETPATEEARRTK